jgi:hypothetical protein
MRVVRLFPALKRLASAVQLRPWPPYFKTLTLTSNQHNHFSPHSAGLPPAENGLKYFTLCRHPVPADAVCVELQRGLYVRIPQQRLHRLRVRLRVDQKRCP